MGANKPLWKVHSGRGGRGTTAVHSATVPGPHCATNETVSENVLKINEHENEQDGLGVVGDTVTLGPIVLHVAKGPVASRIVVIRGKSLKLQLLQPIRLILGCTSIT